MEEQILKVVERLATAMEVLSTDVRQIRSSLDGAMEVLSTDVRKIRTSLDGVNRNVNLLMYKKKLAESPNLQCASNIFVPIIKEEGDCMIAATADIPPGPSCDEQSIYSGSSDCESSGSEDENFIAGMMQESQDMFVPEKQQIVEPKTEPNEDSNETREDGVGDETMVPKREPGSKLEDEVENLKFVVSTDREAGGVGVNSLTTANNDSCESVGKRRSKSNQSSLNVKSVSFDIPNGLHDNIKPATATKYSLRKRNEVTVVSSPRCIKSKKAQKEINKGVCDPASGPASERSKECKRKGDKERVMGTEGDRKSKALREKVTVQEGEGLQKKEGASSTKVKKSYLCQFCSKSFKGTFLLNNHVRVHTGERPFRCTVCHKAFREKSHLIVHIRTHNGERPFQCSSCVKAFVSSSALKSHALVHTGGKRFTCGVCAKKFSHKCDLIKHTRVHTGLKPYNCNLCSKSFSRSDLLTVHKRIHTGVRPYTCTICGDNFRQLCGLSYHSRHVHAHG